MYTIIGLLAIVVSVVLTFVVLIQNSKGGGLSSAFGASNVSAMIGTRRAAQDIEKLTWYFGFGLMVLSFLATMFMAKGEVQQDAGFGAILENPMAAPAPQPAAQPAGPAVNPGTGTPPADK